MLVYNLPGSFKASWKMFRISVQPGDQYSRLGCKPV